MTTTERPGRRVATGRSPADVDLTVELPAVSVAVLDRPQEDVLSVSPPPPTGGGGDSGGARSKHRVRASEPAGASPTGGIRAIASGLPLWRAVSMLVALLLFVFLADISVIGAVRHNRDQTAAYAQLRKLLANSEAPTGQTDFNGVLLPLGSPVALMDAPSIGLHQVVVEGSTSGVLIKGPGHLRDTVLPGQSGSSVILGRAAAFGGPFRRISTLKPGAVITVTTGQGLQSFAVLDVRRSGDPAPAAPKTGRLVLITSGGPSYLPSGLIEVDADLTSKVQPTPARVIGPASLSNSELAQQGDSGALVALVLWLEALLVAAVGVTWLALRKGRQQAWLIGVPVILACCLAASDQAARLLPNLM